MQAKKIIFLAEKNNKVIIKKFPLLLTTVQQLLSILPLLFHAKKLWFNVMFRDTKMYHFFESTYSLPSHKHILCVPCMLSGF